MSDGVLVIAGKLVVDEILWCDHPIAPGSSQRARDWALAGGGQVWHTARAVARAGGRARVVGWAGDDAESQSLRARLRSDGVEDRLVRADVAVRSTVLVGPDGDRSIVSRAGSGYVAAEALAGRGLLDGALLLHIDAYVLDAIGGDAVLALADEARATGVPLSLEPTSERRLGPAVPWLRRLPPLASIIGRPEEVAATMPLLSAAPAISVLHDADRAVVAIAGDRRVEVDVPSADVHTTGAGDRFAAGWLAARARGADLDAALSAGIVAAQESDGEREAPRGSGPG